jgi:Bacterial SH3 domain
MVTPLSSLHTRFATTSLRTSLRVVLSALLVGSSSNILTAYSAPEALPLPSSMISPVEMDTTARDVELKNVEEELLKQLSLGARPTAKETSGTILPDVKHVEIRPVDAKQAMQEPQTLTQPVATATAIAQPKIVVPQEPFLREPRTTSIVPVSESGSPERRRPRTSRATKESTNSKDLEQRITIAESQVSILSQELEITQRKLSETENRLANAQRNAPFNGSGSGEVAFVPSSYDTFVVPTDDTANTNEQAPLRTALPTARVTTDKTPLRIGPGAKEPTLVRLTRNSIVEIEHRTGSWYRVITSSGTRGWITGSFLLFDQTNFPDSTNRVIAYQPSLEPTGIKY